jgi:hypothetical protein
MNGFDEVPEFFIGAAYVTARDTILFTYHSLLLTDTGYRLDATGVAALMQIHVLASLDLLFRLGIRYLYYDIVVLLKLEFDPYQTGNFCTSVVPDVDFVLSEDRRF